MSVLIIGDGTFAGIRIAKLAAKSFLRQLVSEFLSAAKEKGPNG
jgi:hypothetical protein